MTFSRDFREAAIAYKQSEHTFTQLKETFKITPQTYYNLLELKQKTGSLNAHKTENRTRKINIQKLQQILETQPNAYLFEITKHFNCSPQAVQNKAPSARIN